MLQLRNSGWCQRRKKHPARTPLRYAVTMLQMCPNVAVIARPGRTNYLASQPPTWLQAENSEHPVQVAIAAGRCQLRNFTNFDFGPASLTSRTHESTQQGEGVHVRERLDNG